ncbi:unnamed protein product [Heligmosomoides polygyrus]|uniref:Vacuolar-sorting protein SNF8 n=1 Tax=Heligmosomoides polygyrus TaxID=6339 RepID=A0A183GQ26_HELPZ|nr:unnamed protein product [Heligmosomoides polygyrus]
MMEHLSEVQNHYLNLHALLMADAEPVPANAVMEPYAFQLVNNTEGLEERVVEHYRAYLSETYARFAREESVLVPLGGGRFLVQSVPGELSMAHSRVLQLAEDAAYVTKELIIDRLRWDEQRAQAVLDHLVKEGMAWVYEQASDTTQDRDRLAKKVGRTYVWFDYVLNRLARGSSILSSGLTSFQSTVYRAG